MIIACMNGHVDTAKDAGKGAEVDQADKIVKTMRLSISAEELPQDPQRTGDEAMGGSSTAQGRPAAGPLYAALPNGSRLRRSIRQRVRRCEGVDAVAKKEGRPSGK